MIRIKFNKIKYIRMKLKKKTLKNIKNKVNCNKKKKKLKLVNIYLGRKAVQIFWLKKRKIHGPTTPCTHKTIAYDEF